MNSPDNLALTRRRAASGKMPFLLLCDKEILYHGFLCFSAIAVTVTQAKINNKNLCSVHQRLCLSERILKVAKENV